MFEEIDLSRSVNQKLSKKWCDFVKEGKNLRNLDQIK